jgi:hypothetical protein
MDWKKLAAGTFVMLALGCKDPQPLPIPHQGPRAVVHWETLPRSYSIDRARKKRIEDVIAAAAAPFNTTRYGSAIDVAEGTHVYFGLPPDVGYGTMAMHQHSIAGTLDSPKFQDDVYIDPVKIDCDGDVFDVVFHEFGHVYNWRSGETPQREKLYAGAIELMRAQPGLSFNNAAIKHAKKMNDFDWVFFRMEKNQDETTTYLREAEMLNDVSQYNIWDRCKPEAGVENAKRNVYVLDIEYGLLLYAMRAQLLADMTEPSYEAPQYVQPEPADY